MSDLPYVGQELDIFAHAVNWKRYWSACVRPFLAGDVLEVGAGIGANTALLAPNRVVSWVCLEPDGVLSERAAAAIAANVTTAGCKVVTGTTQSLPQVPAFDAILYIDVLEHIENDKEELHRAAGLLKTGGNLIVLSPAHQSLYTAFDRSIGHFRRYERKSLVACGPQAVSLTTLWYLDAVGMLASCGNRLFLRQAMPSLRQILFWDRYMVPPSKFFDEILAHRVGKSILAVWTKK